MLIFIYGDDSFRVQEKVHTLKCAFREKYDPTGLNTAEYPTEKTPKLDPGEVLGSVRSSPFLGERRLVVIRDLIAGVNKSAAGVWIGGLQDTPESSIVIFWENLSPKEIEKKAIYLALKDQAQVYSYPFPVLDGNALNQWTATRIMEQGGTIGNTVLRVLIERVGSDLWQMNHEISKLVAYAAGKEITEEMVNELVHVSFEGKIFDLIDAISQRRPSEALRLLQEERWSGVNDHYLQTMLGRQVRILLGARDLLDRNPRTSKEELAKALNIHPFVAQKALVQARGFSSEHLRVVHGLLFNFDLAVKTGRIDAELAVDLTTIKLSQ